MDIGVAAMGTTPIVLAGGELLPTAMRITLTQRFPEGGDVGTNSKTEQRDDLTRLALLMLHLSTPVQFQWLPP